MVFKITISGARQQGDICQSDKSLLAGGTQTEECTDLTLNAYAVATILVEESSENNTKFIVVLS